MQNNKLSAVIGSLLIGATFAGTAQAAPEASAQAVVAFENFTISRSGGGAQLNANDFSFIQAEATTKVQASVNATSNAPAEGFTAFADNLAQSAYVGIASAPTNIKDQITDNDGGTLVQTVFTAASTFPMGGNFAASGANDFGSPILDFGNASAPDATLYNASYASLTTDGSAGTQSNSGLTAAVQFTTGAGFNEAVTFDFALGAYLATFLSSGDLFTAKASWNVNVSLVDNTTQTEVLVGGDQSFEKNISSNFLNSGSVIEDSYLNLGIDAVDFSVNTIAVSFDSEVLSENTSYSLTATIDTDANVALIGVPEPQMLVLLSMGLIGLGTVAKRKNA